MPQLWTVGIYVTVGKSELLPGAVFNIAKANTTSDHELHGNIKVG